MSADMRVDRLVMDCKWSRRIGQPRSVLLLSVFDLKVC
jgi:hypothetical protein